MAYQLKDRNFTKEYLQKQHRAMQWLADQGLTSGEIRQFSFNCNIDEDTREVVVRRLYKESRYYSGICRVVCDEWDRELRVSVVGSGLEYFFLRERFVSSFMFTRERPRSWRREIAQESLYSLSEIERICSASPSSAIRMGLNFMARCGRMKVLNNAA